MTISRPTDFRPPYSFGSHFFVPIFSSADFHSDIFRPSRFSHALHFFRPCEVSCRIFEYVYMYVYQCLEYQSCSPSLLSYPGPLGAARVLRFGGGGAIVKPVLI